MSGKPRKSARSYDSALYQRFRKRLKAARIAAGLTQAQVAEELGKPQSYIYKCESGERRVDIVELSRFAKLYGRPLQFFADWK